MDDPTKHAFYGEWALIQNESERAEAMEYLRLWKKFLLRKLLRENGTFEFIDEQLIERPPIAELFDHSIGLKIHMKYIPNDVEE